MKSWLALLRRDLTLAFRIGGGGLLAVGFFLLVGALTPLAVGADPTVLARIAAGSLWVAALLACLLSLDRLFQADFEDGSLDVIILSPQPLEAAVLAKCLAHWLTTGLPLTLCAPILGLMLQMDAEGIGRLTLSLAVGAPALSLIGAIGGALTVGVRRGGLLLSLLVLPLYAPTLIFGALSVGAGDQGGGYLMLTAAITLFAAAVSPFASAKALRLNLS